MRGAYVAPPTLLDDDKSAVVKYVSPLSIQRKIFLSPRFVTKHGELTTLVRKATLLPNSKWVIVASAADFDRMFKAALKTHRHGYYVAMLGKNETKDILKKHSPDLCQKQHVPTT